MKKLLFSFVAIMTIVGLAGCGANPDASVSSEQTTSSGTIASSSAPEDIQGSVSELSASQPEPSSSAVETSTATDNETEDSKVLIAYFSRTGNTGTLAAMIQDQTGGELFQITTSEDYSGDYNTVLDKAQEEQRSGARPALASNVENLDDYDIIFIGYPIWWSDTPMTILTFLESHDFTGKTIIPFCTHGSSGAGRSYQSIQAAAPGAAILDGLAVQGSQASSATSTVNTWLDGLALAD